MRHQREDKSFTWEDLESWARKGLITEAQLSEIRTSLQSEAGSGDASPSGMEQRKGLNLITVVYYFGGFMILLAYTIFMGIQWEKLSAADRVAVSAFPIASLWTIGALLRRFGFPGAGGVLIFAGTGIVPLLAYTVESMLGLWPESPVGRAGMPIYRDFYRVVASAWVYMEAISIVATLVVLWRIRLPLLTLLIAVWTWFLSMDLVRWATSSRPGSWGETEQSVGIGVGLGMLLLGLLLQRRSHKEYSLWFYIFGHMIVFSHFSALASSKEGVFGLLYLALYLVFVVASILLQQRVFLVFGALGCYSYASYLAFKVFEGSLGFVFVLALLGLSMVLSAVGYQRWARGWVERAWGHRAEATPMPLDTIEPTVHAARSRR